jgi:oligoribonuclease
MLAWMDLEMTGLDPTRHVIVEIATLITDDQLQIVAEGPDLVIHASEDQLAAMDEVVRAMHTRSGLLPAIEASTVTIEEAGAATLAFLQEHIPDPELARTPLCGNSIGTDRRFLVAWMPEIEARLHYRSVDVSTVKELARRWYPAAVAAAPRKHGSHRALDDIRESVEELAYYRGSIFLPAPESAAEAEATVRGGATEGGKSGAAVGGPSPAAGAGAVAGGGGGAAELTGGGVAAEA